MGSSNGNKPPKTSEPGEKKEVENQSESEGSQQESHENENSED